MLRSLGGDRPASGNAVDEVMVSDEQVSRLFASKARDRRDAKLARHHESDFVSACVYPMRRTSEIAALKFL